MEITNNLFDIRRLFSLSKIELFSNWKIYILKETIIIALFLITTIFSGLTGSFLDPYTFLFINLFIGVVITSSVFNKIHKKEDGILYLMLPSSMEEKFFVKLFFTTIFYFLSTIITIFIASIISNIIRLFLFKMDFSVFNPINKDIFNMFLTYIYFHSIFFLGSVFFKKNNFIMTLLSLVLIFFLLLLLFSVLMVNFFSFVANSKNPFSFFNFINFFNSSSNIFYQIFKFVFLFVIPTLLYLLSYIKFKKAELK